jgi:hypothetical protein
VERPRGVAPAAAGLADEEHGEGEAAEPAQLTAEPPQRWAAADQVSFQDPRHAPSSSE